MLPVTLAQSLSGVPAVRSYDRAVLPRAVPQVVEARFVREDETAAPWQASRGGRPLHSSGYLAQSLAQDGAAAVEADPVVAPVSGAAAYRAASPYAPAIGLLDQLVDIRV